MHMLAGQRFTVTCWLAPGKIINDRRDDGFTIDDFWRDRRPRLAHVASGAVRVAA
jgi:hypothetical protein